MSLRSIVVSTLSKGPIVVGPHASVTIPGVKFLTAFSLGTIDTGSTFKIKYLMERWNWFNRELFGSSMTMPEWEISRKTSDISLLGLFSHKGSGSGKITVHPKLFEVASGESTLLGTLVHEMAHQYVRTVLNINWGTNDADAHGPEWQATMEAIGLPVDAKFLGTRQELQNKQERKVVERLKNPHAKRFTLEDLKNTVNYALYIDETKGQSIPTIVVGSADKKYSGPVVIGFTVNQVRTDKYWRLSLGKLLVPSVLEVEKFPKALFSDAAKSKAYRLQILIT